MKIVAESSKVELPRVASCSAISADLYKAAPPQMKPNDRLTFGMSVNVKQGCCVDKVKTGRPGGCCSHIPHEKFVEHYHASVREVYRTTGVRPVLDKDVEDVLLGKPVQPQEVKPEKKLPAEPIWKSTLLAPVRFVKWLVVGFWQDLKLLFGNPNGAE